MKAAIRSKYGPPEVLGIKEVEKPTPKDNELLVRVYAATASRTDCHILTGLPFFMRLFTGLFKPKLATTGTDFAGQVESTGKDVKSFKPGDRVMGFEFFGLRSHAQYLAIPENKDMILIPGNIAYEQAAACIEGAYYALNGIKAVRPMAGQNALVIGGTGAIGSSYVQFLRFYGVSVTAVCAGENSELVKSIGASRIIDYKTEDFKKDREQYDFVFDAVDKSSFMQCKPLLKKKGKFSSSGGFQNMFFALATSIIGGKKVVFVPPKDLKGCLSFIMELVGKGKFIPVIDRRYPLDKISEAFTYVLSEQKIANVIITMDA